MISAQSDPYIPSRTNSYLPNQTNPVPAAMTPAAQAYREEQLRIADQAAQMNPELTGARPALSISAEDRNKLMSRLIPLLFFDGRVYFATVKQISAVRERDGGVVLANRINIPPPTDSTATPQSLSTTQPPILSLPPNIPFSDFVAKWAPNFAVLYGDPQNLSSEELSRRGLTKNRANGFNDVGQLKFSKIAVNPENVVGIYPEDGWCTVVEVSGASSNKKEGFFASKKDDQTQATNGNLTGCSPTTNLKIATALGDVLRKLRPDGFEDIVGIIGTRDVGFGKRVITG